jgi:anti-sigma regulatory factor (Ser/Thr protein kinase)
MLRQAQYANDPASVAAARHFAREVLGSAAPGTQDRVALVVSELASNAIRHGHSGFGLAIRTSSAGVRVEVTDDSASLPVARQPGRMEPSGRGLLIVQALAEDWGVIGSEHGKAVWAFVATAPGLTSGAGAGRDSRTG